MTTPDNKPTPTDPKSVGISFEELEQAGAKSKSQIIRYLADLGYERAAIAKFLGVKYQHVRNVLTAPQKRKIKAEQEAAKLSKQHPSTLTPRQQLLTAGLRVGPTELGPEAEEEDEDDDDEGFSVFEPETMKKGRRRI
jgi:hypothetical protein